MSQFEFLNNVRVFLLDIEGTTTSISFVKDVLFPYVRNNLRKYLKKNWNGEQLRETIEQLRKLAEVDKQQGVEGVISIPALSEAEDVVQEAVIRNVLWQMDLDRKTYALKLLQGQMWTDGYQSGQLVAHIYEDVPTAMENWVNQGYKIYIYSSGSIQAQKLIFQYTERGNLLHLITGHFDTSTGGKGETGSYKKITETIGVPPEQILFLTDIPKEAYAAKIAGLHACLLERPGNAELTPQHRTEFPVISSFHTIVMIPLDNS